MRSMPQRKLRTRSSSRASLGDELCQRRDLRLNALIWKRCKTASDVRNGPILRRSSLARASELADQDVGASSSFSLAGKAAGNVRLEELRSRIAMSWMRARCCRSLVLASTAACAAWPPESGPEASHPIIGHCLMTLVRKSGRSAFRKIANHLECRELGRNADRRVLGR